MAFSFTTSKTLLALQVEWVSIGCEARIDVSRFCATEEPGNPGTSGDDSRSTPSQSPLWRSRVPTLRKFWTSTPESLD